MKVHKMCINNRSSFFKFSDNYSIKRIMTRKFRVVRDLKTDNAKEI